MTEKKQQEPVYEYLIVRLSYPVNHGCFYNVQRRISHDGGKTFLYCGVGIFFRDRAEAEAYIEKDMAKSGVKTI